MKEVIIYEFQLESICNALRVVANAYDCRENETCLDRMVTQAEQYAINALAGEKDKRVRYPYRADAGERSPEGEVMNTDYFKGVIEERNARIEQLEKLLAESETSLSREKMQHEITAKWAAERISSSPENKIEK